jgi:hypothetical protein
MTATNKTARGPPSLSLPLFTVFSVFYFFLFFVMVRIALLSACVCMFVFVSSSDAQLLSSSYDATFLECITYVRIHKRAGGQERDGRTNGVCV